MADPLIIEHQHPPDNSDSNPNLYTEEFDCLPIPPPDPLFFSAENPSSATNAEEAFVSDLPLNFDDNFDFDISLDNLEFYFPKETEPFLIPDTGVNHGSPPLHSDSDFSHQCCSPTFDPANSGLLEPGSSGISGDHGPEFAKYLICSPSEAGSCNSGDRSSDSVGVVNFSSPLSSQVSGNGGSAVSEGMNASSPDSGNFVDEKIKFEEVNTKIGVPKRKKETSEEGSGETRNQKYRKSENDSPNTDGGNPNSQSDNIGASGGEEVKRRARLLRNRESAQLSRQRKKHYVEELEDKVRTMHSTIADLNGKISFIMAENVSLRQQLSGNGMCPPPMYPPMAPMGYPWVPCGPYVVKPQGSQVPLVPIPRLKPQQPTVASKPKRPENKKPEGKTKKVAGVSFLGLLFFIFLFGGLVPILNVRFGVVRDNGVNGFGFLRERFYDQHKGRVLMVNGHSNGSHENVGVRSSNGKIGVGDRIHCERGRSRCSEYDVDKKGVLGNPSGSDELIRLGNASEPLVASLYVPRNDKLVKIDGNLIIHSVMASERAMASDKISEVNNNKETSLAIARGLPLAVGSNGRRYSHLYQSHTERQKSLTTGPTSNLKDHSKSSAADGKLQQWFREGLAGPMLSSGMCTEVFQFDVSAASGAIVPASSVNNITAEHSQNATRLNKGKNRRILHGLPVPVVGSDLNITGEQHVGRNSHKNNFQGNKSTSSMVVSVLVDPREAGDSDVDGMIPKKSLSRIFVVVLLDSVKYVTYSCMLPRPGPHLVTT